MTLKTALFATLGVSLTGGSVIGGYYLFKLNTKPDEQISNNKSSQNQERIDSRDGAEEKSPPAQTPTTLTPAPQERQPNNQDQGTGGQAQQTPLNRGGSSDTESREVQS